MADHEPISIQYRGYIQCAKPNCSAATKVSNKWERVKTEGDWFFQRATDERDELAWCPVHHPEWVAGWRAKQEAKKEAANR